MTLQFDSSCHAFDPIVGQGLQDLFDPGFIDSFLGRSDGRTAIAVPHSPRPLSPFAGIFEFPIPCSTPSPADLTLPRDQTGSSDSISETFPAGDAGIMAWFPGADAHDIMQAQHFLTQLTQHAQQGPTAQQPQQPPAQEHQQAQLSPQHPPQQAHAPPLAPQLLPELLLSVATSAGSRRSSLDGSLSCIASLASPTSGDGHHRSWSSDLETMTMSSGDAATPPTTQEEQGGAPASAEQHNNSKLRGRAQLGPLKDRNREAQRRFRERQKARLQETEIQVTELQKQMQALRAEKECLEQRNAVLEHLTASNLDPQILNGFARSGARLVDERWWMDPVTLQVAEATAGLGLNLTCTVVDGEPLKLTCMEAASLPLAEFNGMWTRYIKTMAENLIDAAGDAASPAGQRLAGLAYEAVQMTTAIAISRPGRLKKHFLMSDTSTDAPTNPTPDTWRQLATRLAFTDGQKQQISCVRAMFAQRLAALAKNRQELAQWLQGGLPLMVHSGIAAQQPPTATAADAYVTVEAMERMLQVVRAEHSLVVQFMQIVLGNILTPFQYSRACIESFPWAPDFIAVINSAAEEQGDIPLAQVLGAATLDAPAAVMAALPINNSNIFVVALQQRDLLGDWGISSQRAMAINIPLASLW